MNNLNSTTKRFSHLNPTLFTCLLPALLLLSGCNELTDADKEKAQEQLSQLLIKLRGANLVEPVDPELLPQACDDFYLPIGGNTSGACITPMAVKGHVSSVNLTGNYFGGGIRLFGGGSGFGQNMVIEGSSFDMENPEAIGGEDNAQDTAFSSLNNRIETKFNALDIQFAIPRDNQNGKGNEFWTFKYVFVDYPFTQTATYTPGINDGDYTATGNTVADCIEDAYPDAVTDATNNNSNLLGGVTGAKAGDIMICRKLTSLLSCQASDYLWLDTQNNEFTSTRPADDNTFKFDSLANHKVTCEPQDQGYNIDLGGFNVAAELYQQVMFSAQIDRSSKIYEFEQNGVSDSYQKDSEINLLIDIDVRKSLFIHAQDTDFSLASTPVYDVIESKSDSDIAQAIWFKPVMVWQNSPCTPWAPGECEAGNNSSVVSGLNASINVSLKGETEHPIFVCEDNEQNSAQCQGSD